MTASSVTILMNDTLVTDGYEMYISGTLILMVPWMLQVERMVIQPFTLDALGMQRVVCLLAQIQRSSLMERWMLMLHHQMSRLITLR